MNNVVLESISNITHEQYEAMRNTSNCIIYYESKIDYMESYENDTCEVFIFKEGRIFDIDGDELFLVTESDIPTNSNGPTDNSQFDFTGHNLDVGTANLAIAQILREIFDYSKIYHHGKTTGTKDLLYNGTMYGSNLAKYQKTFDLMNQMESSKQNFCRLYYAGDNVGQFKGQRAYVFFAEMTLPSGTFYFSWHLMRDGVKSKNTNKNTPKNKICNNINDFTPTGNRVIKYGKSKFTEYQNMESKYEDFYKRGVNGIVVLNKLIEAFKLPR